MFGLICLSEFNKLIHQKNIALLHHFYQYYFCRSHIGNTLQTLERAYRTFHKYYSSFLYFVNLLLIRDLFSSKSLPTLLSNHFINTTFYVSSGFVFLILIALNFENYSTEIIMYIFILIWINDSFAYIVGKNFGKQKLFESISPKKTVEGFLGGVFFAALGSYVIANYTEFITFY